MSVTNFIYIVLLSFSACTSAGDSKKSEKEIAANDTQTAAAGRQDAVPAANNEKEVTTPATWQVVAKGNQSSIQEARNVIIKSQAEFDKLWKEAFEGVHMTDGKPTINFNEKWVVAAFLGMVNTGGHELDIKDIAADGTITLKHIKPGTGCMSSMAIEFPYVIATVNHLSSAKQGFKTVTEEKKCE